MYMPVGNTRQWFIFNQQIKIYGNEINIGENVQTYTVDQSFIF